MSAGYTIPTFWTDPAWRLWLDSVHDISDGISAKLGQTMNLIKQFNDFHLIKIVPSKGTIISGFGSAFNLKGASLKVDNKIKP